ncbi:hypothetical protein ACFL2Q_17180 [Thermodesulfobacteriota bacterium]
MSTLIVADDPIVVAIPKVFRLEGLQEITLQVFPVGMIIHWIHPGGSVPS